MRYTRIELLLLLLMMYIHTITKENIEHLCLLTASHGVDIGLTAPHRQRRVIRRTRAAAIKDGRSQAQLEAQARHRTCKNIMFLSIKYLCLYCSLFVSLK